MGQHALMTPGHLRRAPLTLALLALTTAGLAQARVRLGELLPPHPWPSSEREIVVVYSHDCGDLGELWQVVAAAGLPVRAVNAEELAAPAPGSNTLWRGEGATAFSRALRVGTYPAVLLVRGGRVLNAWEGTFNVAAAATLGR
jgi:hypothetical protein